MRVAQPEPTRREALNLRIKPQVRELIDRAAELTGKNRTDFVLDAARRAAEDILLDRTVFKVSPASWRQFLALLDAPAQTEQAASEEYADACAVGINAPLSSPEPLTSDHQTESFDSGEPLLDDWLRRRARANQASGASRTYVVCEATRVVAYYAIASGAVAQTAVPGRFRRNMPDPIPVVVLARLAVDRTYQGRGLGRALFRDAARRVAQAADVIGIRGILVHAISDDVRKFYIALGFDPCPAEAMTLVVTIQDIRSTLESG